MLESLNAAVILNKNFFQKKDYRYRHLKVDYTIPGIHNYEVECWKLDWIILTTRQPF